MNVPQVHYLLPFYTSHEKEPTLPLSVAQGKGEQAIKI